MSARGHDLAPEPEYGSTEETRPSQAVAGFLAAAAMFVGIACLFYYPARLGPGALLVGVVAAGMGGTLRRFTAIALAVTVFCFTWGMIIAVLLDRPII